MNETNRIRRGVTAVASLAVVAAGVAAPAVVAPAAAVGPTWGACGWLPDVLPLPEDTFHGKVTAGAGEWLAGVAGADGPNQAVRWRDGRAEPLGPAFGMDTAVTAINPGGELAGTVTTPDGTRHAIRHRDGRFERLPETGGSSVALDINAGGDVVGHDGGRLVVWPAKGAPRHLDVPQDEAPYGKAAIDDDGTVAARTGDVTTGRLRWHGYAWPGNGTRIPLPPGDVHDLRDGQVVGTTEGAARAVGWHVTGGGRPYLGGTKAVAINDDGLVAGTGADGEPLLWTGALPVPLPTPPRHVPGTVTALNTTEAGGSAYPADGLGAVPVRWRCR